MKAAQGHSTLIGDATRVVGHRAYSWSRAQVIILGLRALVVGAALTVAITTEARTEETSEEGVLRAGLWEGLFEGFNRVDALAAAKLWVEAWGKKSGIYHDTRAQIYNNVNKLRDLLQSGALDVVVVPSRQFFILEADRLVTADLATARSSGVGDEFVIVVPANASYGDLLDLRQKSLRLMSSGYHTICRDWLAVHLQAANLGMPEDFFNKIEPAEKPAQVVLPVFFGKADACLIGREEFEMMVELNPQVGRRLRVVVTSPRIIPLLICFAPDYSPAKRSLVEKSLVNLNQDPRTNQILTLHRIEKVVALEEEDLAKTRKLYREHANLSAQMGLQIRQTILTKH